MRWNVSLRFHNAYITPKTCYRLGVSAPIKLRPKVGAGRAIPSHTQTVARKRPQNGGTAGKIASELGYSVSYVLAVKKAMYPDAATRPRRLDPVEVSEWIFAHPSFRMRDVYECHPKDVDRGQRLLEI